MLTDLLLVPFDTSWAELADQARAGEAAGFDGLWTWDHLSGAVHRQDHVLECWTVLAALAATVPRVTLGPLVLNVDNRHPGLLAQMAATLAEVAPGRVVVGLGAGGGAGTPYPVEQLMLGRSVGPDPARRRQVEEAAIVLRHLWSARTDSVEGEHYALRRPAGFLHPAPRPPVVVGGFGPLMAELAGRVADGFNTQATHPHLDVLLATARAAHAAEGHDPAGFTTSVFAGFAPSWCEPGNRARERLARLGVDRLILICPPGTPTSEIDAAGARLR